MTERKPFSIEQSEELIAQLKTETSSEFEQLRKTLKLLGQVPELSQGMVPPALPSTVNENVVSLTRKSSKSHRPILTSIITVGILASATLTAAAVTGRGPAPIVAVAHETAKFVKNVVGAVTSVVTGNNSNSSTESINVASQPAVPTVETPAVVPTTSSEVSTEDTLLPELTKIFPEVAESPGVVQPETQITEKSHADESKTTEPKTTRNPSTPPLPTNGENGVEGENSSNGKTSESPRPEPTPSPQATQAPDVQPSLEATQAPDVQPSPEISTPDVQSSETESP